MEDKALIFDIKRDCSEDGPGVRTTIFFKGCPLSCVWCQNPEGKYPSLGISFVSEACRPSECGAPCVEVCEAGCLKLYKTLKVDHSICTRCDNCFKVCPTNAIEPVGYWISREELIYRVLIDKPFYRSTNGGITISGGEATMQIGFLNGFLKELKKEEIHIVLETGGFFDLKTFKNQILPYLDLIYFDIKLFDDKESHNYTGQSNKTILENFDALVREAKIPIIPRIPLVPDITTTKENLTGIAQFLRKQNVQACSLMPYNPLWQGKPATLGLPLEYINNSYMTKDEERDCAQYLSCFGV